MGAISIVLLATLFSLVSIETKLVIIELAVPDIVTSLFGTNNTVFRNSSVQNFRSTGEQTLKKLSTVIQDIIVRFNWETLSKILQLFFMRRASEPKPMVEEAPGVFKSEILTYPPKLFTNRLKNLLKIKAMEEKKNRDLNAPK